MRPQAPQSARNLATGWDAYVKGLDGVGLPRYLELQQQAYDKSKSKGK